MISDGERVIWDARPTHPTPAEPLRYTMSHAAVVRASEFESSIDEFIARVRGRLAAEGITGSNLDAVCPHEALEDFLAGDSSPELLADAADHFRVSELAVRTLLVNHGRLSREDLDSDPERQIAA